jgi:FkbM family methyltransferase
MKFRDRLLWIRQARMLLLYACVVVLMCVFSFIMIEPDPSLLRCGADSAVRLVYGPLISFWVSLHPSDEDRVVSKGLREHHSYSSIDEVHAVCSAALGVKCSDGRLFVEVGSSVGAVSLYAATRGMRVLAFDPLEVNVQRLEQSRCLNCHPVATRCAYFHPKTFSVRHALVGAQPDLVPVVESEPGNLAATMRGGGAVRSLNVSVVTLDAELSHTSTPVELLLLTCQGAELDALLGADALLKARRIRHIIWRLHHMGMDYEAVRRNTSRRILDRLWAAGFRRFYDLEASRRDGVSVPRLLPSDAYIVDYVLRAREPGAHPNVLVSLVDSV